MTDYATLQARIVTRSARGDLAAQIPEFIESAEQMIREQVRTLDMQQRTDLVVPDTGFVALPDRFLGFRSVALSGAIGLGQNAECNYLPPDQFHEKRLNAAAFSGVTRDPFYTLEGGNIWLLPTPGAGSSSTLSVSFFQAYPTLNGTTVLTNALLTDHFNLYLWAAMADLCNYIKDDAEEAKFLEKFTSNVARLHRSERRKARSGPHVRRPGRVTP